MSTERDIQSNGQRELFIGLAFLALGFMGFLSLISYTPGDVSALQNPPNPSQNFIGSVGAWFSFASFITLGVAGYALPVLAVFFGLMLVFRPGLRVWPRLIWMGVLLGATVMLVALAPGMWAETEARLNICGLPAGVVGQILVDRWLLGAIGGMGTASLAWSLFVVALIFFADVHPVTLGGRIGAVLGRGWRLAGAWLMSRWDRMDQIEHDQKQLDRRAKELEKVLQPRFRTTVRPGRKAALVQPEAGGFDRPAVEPEPEVTAAVEPPPEEREPEPEPPPRRRAAVPAAKPEKAEKPEAADPAPPPPPGSYLLPPITLLAETPPAAEREIRGDFKSAVDILQETLNEFGIDAQVTNVEQGPVVTRFEVTPAPGVRVERIASLSNNIALAMKAESVRIQAPIPGKGVVGIEVPNSKTTAVYVREVIESEAWQNSRAALPLALGKDVSGRVLIGDLAKMPHMLIAGATGSGKTVCMNALLTGLLMSRTPDQLRLLLVDPKIVEFAAYQDLPHLVVPVITEPKKVIFGFKWAINEMEKRYKLFAKVGVRNIEAFNNRKIVKQPDLFEGQDPAAAPPPGELPDKVPYIVIVVDELADLMLVAQAEIENQIARLAQLSRAVGIHLILATQRPSVNVITGTIKANFPARIAFQVAQKNDSRTILDANGADKLLGRGDMLFLPPGSSKLIRAQGTLVLDEEILRITEFVRNQGQPRFIPEIHEKLESNAVSLPDMEEDDELVEQCIEIVRQTRRASTSALQRRLRIGYNRAARLMDLLEQKGIVGPPRGSDPREILIDLDGEIPSNEPAVSAEPAEQEP